MVPKLSSSVDSYGHEKASQAQLSRMVELENFV